MAELVVIGDLHEEGVPAIVPEPLRSQAVGRVLDQAIAYCREHGVNHLVLLGDLYETPHPAPDSYLPLLGRAHATRDWLQWHAINGNHDYLDISHNALNHLVKLVGLGLLNNFSIYLQPTAIQLDKLRLVFLPWPHKRSPLLVKVPPSLVFAHVPRAGVTSDTGYVFEANEDNDWPLGSHFWLLGDVHKAQRGKQYEFPGTPLQTSFFERKTRHFCHVKARPQHAQHGRLTVISEHIHIVPPYTLHRAAAATVAELEQLTRYNPSEQFVRLVVPPELYSERASITKRFSNVVVVPSTTRQRKEEKEPDKITKLRHSELLRLREGGMSLRMELLQGMLKDEGFTPSQIRRGLRLAKQVEMEAMR